MITTVIDDTIKPKQISIHDIQHYRLFLFYYETFGPDYVKYAIKVPFGHDQYVLVVFDSDADEVNSTQSAFIDDSIVFVRFAVPTESVTIAGTYNTRHYRQ